MEVMEVLDGLLVAGLSATRKPSSDRIIPNESLLIGAGDLTVTAQNGPRQSR